MGQRSHSHKDLDGIAVSTVGPKINRKYSCRMTEKPPLGHCTNSLIQFPQSFNNTYDFGKMAGDLA